MKIKTGDNYLNKIINNGRLISLNKGYLCKLYVLNVFISYLYHIYFVIENVQSHGSIIVHVFKNVGIVSIHMHIYFKIHDI